MIRELAESGRKAVGAKLSTWSRHRWRSNLLDADAAGDFASYQRAHEASIITLLPTVYHNTT